MPDYDDPSDVLNDLFDGRLVITAAAIASAFNLEQAEVSAAARDAGAQMLGSAYAIDRDTADAILEQFDLDGEDECEDDDAED